MLSDIRVEANIPASDLTRARDFYADTLGLTPTAEYGGESLAYRTSAIKRFCENFHPTYMNLLHA